MVRSTIVLNFEGKPPDGKSARSAEEGPRSHRYDGGPVPAHSTLPGHIKASLPNGQYTYDVDCCPKETNPRNVLVP